MLAQLRERKARTESDIARSVAEAPSATLPMVAPRPVGEMLLMEVDSVWTPDSPRWWNESIERAVPGASAALPHRIAYGAKYARKDSDDFTSVGVSVTEFPSADWARYQLRNTPNANDSLLQREYMQTWHRGAQSVFQLGTICFCSSGRMLVVVDISNVPRPFVDVFLQAYLEKYPSSIQ